MGGEHHLTCKYGRDPTAHELTENRGITGVDQGAFSDYGRTSTVRSEYDLSTSSYSEAIYGTHVERLQRSQSSESLIQSNIPFRGDLSTAGFLIG